MKSFAPQRVPIATPIFCLYIVPLKLKILFNTKFNNFLVMNGGKPMSSLCCNNALIPSSCGMLVYKLLTSTDMSKVSFSVFSLRFFIISNKLRIFLI